MTSDFRLDIVETGRTTKDGFGPVGKAGFGAVGKGGGDAFCSGVGEGGASEDGGLRTEAGETSEGVESVCGVDVGGEETEEVIEGVGGPELMGVRAVAARSRGEAGAWKVGLGGKIGAGRTVPDPLRRG